jgi:ATPase family associated with various cellular activities (AAA)
MPQRKTAAGPIVVAGDVSIDWLAWPQPADQKINSNNWRQREGTRMVARRGGALLLTDILRAVTKRKVIGPRVEEIELKGPDVHLHSMVDLERFADNSGRFHIAKLRGFAGPSSGVPPQPPLERTPKRAAVLVFDDSGNGFRDCQAVWKPLIAQTRPRWLIIKMSRPLERNPLLGWLCNVAPEEIGFDPERVVIVVNADDLRAEAIPISRRLSWERTAGDFVREIGSNVSLTTLATCAHLIVRFDCDGVIHHRGTSDADPVLYFDPGHAEGEFVENVDGRMMGMTGAFTAGLAAALAEGGGTTEVIFDRAIIRGMNAAHRTARIGFEADSEGRPDYPHAETMIATPCPEIESIGIRRSLASSNPMMWSILDDQVGDVFYAARRIVTDGPDKALEQVPVGRFGELVTADRSEIESYRAISNLFRDYLSVRQSKPLSIVVFGPPGAGKSFGVQQVAANARPAGSPKLPVLEFNLSQFGSPADLISAFHLVRDQALSGAVPLVFFDEFDGNFGDQLDGEFGWLRYFLAPMQDGKFREAGHMHPLGAAIFVFAGGTRRTLEQFVEPMTFDVEAQKNIVEGKNADTEERKKWEREREERKKKYERFVAVKGPDFASRLRGYINIRGPDPVDKDDRMFPVRRAFLLRSMLERREKLLKREDGFEIAQDVLNALLTVPSYRHGARSMEALLGMSSLTGSTQFSAAALPSTEQMEAHVKASDFMSRVKPEGVDDDLRERLGRLLHEVYRKQRIAIAENDFERAQLASDAAMEDWDHLAEAFRESSRLQADDIPYKLRLIGCYMAREVPGRIAIEAFSRSEVDRLGQVEHERYNAERLRLKWRLGDRDPSKRRSPFLVPWERLDRKWQTLDEAAVIAIPQVLAKVGWRVYRKKN